MVAVVYVCMLWAMLPDPNKWWWWWWWWMWLIVQPSAGVYCLGLRICRAAVCLLGCLDSWTLMNLLNFRIDCAIQHNEHSSTSSSHYYYYYYYYYYFCVRVETQTVNVDNRYWLESSSFSLKLAFTGSCSEAWLWGSSPVHLALTAAAAADGSSPSHQGCGDLDATGVLELNNGWTEVGLVTGGTQMNNSFRSERSVVDVSALVISVKAIYFWLHSENSAANRTLYDVCIFTQSLT